MLQYLLIPNQYQGFNIRDSLEKIVSFINMGQCLLPGDPCLITIKMDTLNKKCYLTVEKKRKKKSECQQSPNSTNKRMRLSV